MLNAYNIVFAAFLAAAGRLADLMGRKRVFILGRRCSPSRPGCARSPKASGNWLRSVCRKASAQRFCTGLLRSSRPRPSGANGANLWCGGVIAAGLARRSVAPHRGGWLAVGSQNLPLGYFALAARRALVENWPPDVGAPEWCCWLSRAGPDAGIDQGPGLGQPCRPAVIAGRGGRMVGFVMSSRHHSGTDGRAHAVAHPVVRGRTGLTARPAPALRLFADARAVLNYVWGYTLLGGWHGRRLAAGSPPVVGA